MKTRNNLQFIILASALIIGLLGAYNFLSAGKESPDFATAYGRLGERAALQSAFVDWAAQHEQNGGDRNVRMAIGWSKAYSKELNGARGRAVLNLIDGTVSVTIKGLKDPDVSDVWLVDNQSGPGRSAMPERGDRVLWVGSLKHDDNGRATLFAELGEALAEFEVDLVLVTRNGKNPLEPGVLYGSPGLFQRLYTRARTGRFPATPTSPLVAIGPASAHASVAVPSLDLLVQRGADLFFNETFKGNGRTCGTCHPAENNLTIDPEFIATLPANDSLFVAEFLPALAENFEKPELMRELGLILENTNGFGDLANDFTMRGVPHTLALSTSLTAAPGGADGTTMPPDQRTGWSGDGAPGSGTLRDFAAGAVRQHFTKTLNRCAAGEACGKPDFRLPTDEELDAMEAFQLFLGRQEDPDLPLPLRSQLVSRGQRIFLCDGLPSNLNCVDGEGEPVAPGKCNACHSNGGANVRIPSVGAFNFNFNTGVENLPDQPADLIDAANNPADNGFGLDVPGNMALNTFNTPSLIEAADTGPFFHNNSIETIEGAVAFYTSNAFNNSPAAAGLAPPITASAGIQLETTEVIAVAAFLRVLNVLENIRSASETAGFTLDVKGFRSAHDLLKLAIAEVEDGKQVLDAGGLHPSARQSLTRAEKLLQNASHAHSRVIRNRLIQRALKRLEDARRVMVES